MPGLTSGALHTRDDRPEAIPAVQQHIFPLHEHRHQLQCPAHECTLGNAPTLSSDIARAVDGQLPPCACTRTLPLQTAPIGLRHELAHPQPRPLGLFNPRRFTPSLLGSLSSMWLCSRMRDHGIHCRQVEPCHRQHQRNVATKHALHHALLSDCWPDGNGPVAKPYRRPAAANRANQAGNKAFASLERFIWSMSLFLHALFDTLIQVLLIRATMSLSQHAVFRAYTPCMH